MQTYENREGVQRHPRPALVTSTSQPEAQPVYLLNPGRERPARVGFAG